MNFLTKFMFFMNIFHEIHVFINEFMNLEIMNFILLKIFHEIHDFHVIHVFDKFIHKIHVYMNFKNVS